MLTHAHAGEDGVFLVLLECRAKRWRGCRNRSGSSEAVGWVWIDVAHELERGVLGAAHSTECHDSDEAASRAHFVDHVRDR